MLQNIPKEKIIELVKQGPTYPAKIAKAIGGGGDTMLIGAILSTLISSGDVKVSTLKIGGSPLYYSPEQESKLEDFISYLNDKDKKTFRLLKEDKILQDSAQDPLIRVSLRAIKDFAKSFEIDFNKQKVLFWRFYSVSKDDAVLMAKKIVSEIKPVEVEVPVPEPVIAQKLEPKQEHKPSLILEPKPVEKSAVEKHVIEKPVVMENTAERHNIEHHTERHTEHPVEHIAAHSLEHPVDVVQQVLEEHALAVSDKAHEKHEHEMPEHHEHYEIHDKDKHSKLAKAAKTPKTPKQPKVIKEQKEPKQSKAPKLEYNFFELILNHVASKKLDVISKEKIKKTEYDLVLKNHNNNEYIYCKAKDKSTINEGDIAPALIFAHNKKMPCLFLSTGELSKNASILITNEFSGLTFERIIVEAKSNI